MANCSSHQTDAAPTPEDFRPSSQRRIYAKQFANGQSYLRRALGLAHKAAVRDADGQKVLLAVTSAGDAARWGDLALAVL
jgi:hypothetical protein